MSDLLKRLDELMPYLKEGATIENKSTEELIVNNINITLFPNVTRVEVIDDQGRTYSQWDVRDVQVSFQDDDRTLKIFLRGNNET